MSLPLDWRNQFSQMTLLDETAAPSAAPSHRTRGRPQGSAFETEILKWVGYYRCVTSIQVYWRFWGLQGKTNRYGAKLIRRLEDQGLLVSSALEPAKGRSSLRVLQVTAPGWRRLGQAPPPDTRRKILPHVMLYRLQFAETMMVRESEHWHWMTRTSFGAALKAEALGRYRGRVLTGTEQVQRDALRDAPTPEMPLHGMRHLNTGELRMLLPIRRGQSASRFLERMPPRLRNVAEALGVEIVAAGHEELAAGQRLLARFAAESGVRINTYSCDHFSLRHVPTKANQA